MHRNISFLLPVALSLSIKFLKSFLQFISFFHSALPINPILVVHEPSSHKSDVSVEIVGLFEWQRRKNVCRTAIDWQRDAYAKIHFRKPINIHL